ncbi:hypothetical protein CJO75_22275 (plasmid) [Ralstonia solanacearum]|nr:hypothetical protein CDC45_23220 [Ralstonia pseudosolanacearum]AXV75157.1 hypothetical protein CJO75_22275 [Ralstonia solanacearum]AST88389.1 hypothetical protein CIG66_18095 [Ralstonia pseudosolanacearum]AXW16849.1 hypothetical protein CJO84_19845 [Ralstonia solanacearum]AXW41021.1 hypothetical protein CJO89_22850 [Ralstonia solanacearum]
MTRHIRMPRVQSQPCSRRPGKPVWLKMGAAQPSAASCPVPLEPGRFGRNRPDGAAQMMACE